MIKGYSVNQRRLEYLEKTVKLIDITSRVNEEVNASDVKEIIKVINDLKFNESSDLFTLERNEGLKAILGSVYQTFNGKDVYYSLEEKCANLLYMIW